MAKDIKNKADDNKKTEGGNSPYFNLDDEKAFIEEVDEEVRNEKFKKLMNKYGIYLLSLLIIALAFAVGYEKIGAWQINRAEQKNVQYVKATTPSADYEDNIAELEIIVKEESGLYKDIAQLQIANILLDNGQTEKALIRLENIFNGETASEKIKDIARIKFATYKIDSYTFAEVKSLLTPVIEKNGAWAPMGKELLAMSAIQNKDYDTGRKIYEELLKNTEISEEFKARINDMLASINDVK